MIHQRVCMDCGNVIDTEECNYCREKKEEESDGTKS